jgi:uncharacterized protein YycO
MDMLALLRRKILALAYPFLKKIGKLHAPWSHKAIKAKHVMSVLKFVKEGDIFLTRTNGEATNLVIPSQMKHAAIYVGNAHVIEAKDPIVVKSNLFDFMMSKDNIMVMRPRLSDDERLGASAFADTLLGHPYDYRFDIDRKRINDAFYCAEVPYWCYSQTVKSWGFTLREVMGVPTIKPDDYILASKFFDLVWTDRLVER